MTVNPDDLPLHRDADGNVVTITEEQGRAIWRAITIWQQVYFDAKGELPLFTRANLQKSCLLGRLLYEGKPPLPDPPPTIMSAPWYNLIENGRAQIHRDEIKTREGGGGVLYALFGGSRWIVQEMDDTELILTHENTGETRWRVRDVRPEDDPKKGGMRRVGDKWEPIYFTGVIERIS